MASRARIGTAFLVATTFALGSAATSTGQIIVSNPGRPPVHPAYWYIDHDASVRLDVKPRRTTVYVDGHDAGLVDNYDGILRRLRRSPGSHEITLYLAGYRTYSRRMYLTVEKTLTFHHPMEKLAPREVSEPPPAPVPRSK